MSQKQYPDGSLQAICSAAIALLALLIAFIGYTGFKSSDPWSRGDLLHLIPFSLAVVFLAVVPFLATRKRPTGQTHKSIDVARMSFGLRTLLTILGIMLFLIRDYVGHHR
jgi:multisubunit Na+/H+ antiporter MnhB subunit